MTKKIALLVGSESKSSVSQRIADYLVENAPQSLQLFKVSIAKLPLYDRDFDELAEQPSEYERFRNELKAAVSFIWISPEHNAAPTAAIKNAIDVASRPWGAGIWTGKAVGIISSAASRLGGAIAADQLRTIASLLEMPVLPFNANISESHLILNEEGKISHPSVIRLLDKFLVKYEEFVAKF